MRSNISLAPYTVLRYDTEILKYDSSPPAARALNKLRLWYYTLHGFELALKLNLDIGLL